MPRNTQTPSARVIRSNVLDVPHWDPDRRELKFENIVVKWFKQAARDQERILAAFEEEGWPSSIFDPLPLRLGQSAKKRLHKTIEHLNRARQNPLISFHGDGTGQRVSWRIVDASPSKTRGGSAGAKKA